MNDPAHLLEPILALQERIRLSVVNACGAQATEQLSAVAGDDAGDTIYGIDRVSEAVLLEGFAELARTEPLCLVAEGLGVRALPEGASEADCRWRILVDPIDGTRGLMYQKRSGWVLTGVAPNRGADTRLSDIVLAVQTEIPLLKQHLYDTLWAVRSHGAQARRTSRLTGLSETLAPKPSGAESIAHGFATVVRFFPGARDVLAAVDDEVVRALLGTPAEGKAACFEDQYASTGGQLYELMAGHDRFIADLRPLVQKVLAERGLPRGLCCHPYDLCTALIAQESGVVLTGADGESLDAPLDVTSDVAWVGYANQRLRAGVEPALHAALARHGLAA